MTTDPVQIPVEKSQIPVEKSQIPAEKRQIPVKKTRLLLLESWDALRPAVKAIFEDTVVFLLVVLVLVLVSHFLNKMPYEAGRKATLEGLHYYTSIIVLVMFGFDLVWKIFVFMFRKNGANNA